MSGASCTEVVSPKTLEFSGSQHFWCRSRITNLRVRLTPRENTKNTHNGHFQACTWWGYHRPSNSNSGTSTSTILVNNIALIEGRVLFIQTNSKCISLLQSKVCYVIAHQTYSLICITSCITYVRTYKFAGGWGILGATLNILYSDLHLAIAVMLMLVNCIGMWASRKQSI